jgi:hypothetical protein
MTYQIPQIPNPHELLPPLLACLPLSAFSPQPPPALPILLTPILRQRLQLLSSSSNPPSESSSWLPLLNWDRDEGAKLPALLHEIDLEPHPVSGEVELGDVDIIEYRRLDSETLHSRFKLPQFKLLATYLWCMRDPKDGGSEWLLSELKKLEPGESNRQWYRSLEDADSALGRRDNKSASQSTTQLSADAADEDDGSYWAAYDRTPSRTPAKHSPAPGSQAAQLNRISSTNELDYFDRYVNEVQPSMDPYDPSEGAVPESTLNHHESEFNPRDEALGTVISHPRPQSSSSKASVEKLEEEAEKSIPRGHAETSIKQHISTDIKSLYRLARSTGISMQEFRRVVETELELLPMMDME